MLVLRQFAVRGVVEGFYGAPWTHDARLEVMSFLAGRGMNAYAYAPKDDARHRAEWRVPYDKAELEHFRELSAYGEAHGVKFGFAISPGLDITYASPADRAQLRKIHFVDRPIRGSDVTIAITGGAARRASAEAANPNWRIRLLDRAGREPGAFDIEMLAVEGNGLALP